MSKLKFFAPILFAATMAPAAASDYPCAAPDVPERSTSNESVRRVQKEIRIWHRCHTRHTAGGQVSPEAQLASRQADASIRTWLENTRAYSRTRAPLLASIERERRTFLRDSPRTTPVLR